MDTTNEIKQESFRDVEPRVDILENEDEILLIADLPGVLKNDLDIQIKDERLSIVGKRQKQEELLGKQDFWNVNYQRHFKLGKDVDVDKIEAELKNGTLTIHLPKSPEVKSRKIAIQSV